MVTSDYPDGEIQVSLYEDGITTFEKTLDDITYLTQSHNRLQTLKLIYESDCTQEELQRQLDIHRTTLRRTLCELEKKNWIESMPTEKAYCILPAGRIVVRSLYQTLTNIQTADSLGKFLTLLPEDLPIPAQSLRACNITSCDTHGPYAPMQRLRMLVRGTETFRGFIPVFNPMYIDMFQSKISDGNEIDIIVSMKAFETMQCKYPSALDSALQADSVQLFVAGDLPQFEVALLDEVITIGVYDQNMRVHSLLEADTEQQQVTTWANEQYDTQRTTADAYGN